MTNISKGHSHRLSMSVRNCVRTSKPDFRNCSRDPMRPAAEVTHPPSTATRSPSAVYGGGGESRRRGTEGGCNIRRRASTLLFGVALLAMAGTSHAATPAEFYKGRTLPVIIGYSAGGGYDLYARVLSQYMG